MIGWDFELELGLKRASGEVRGGRAEMSGGGSRVTCSISGGSSVVYPLIRRAARTFILRVKQETGSWPTHFFPKVPNARLLLIRR